jgi:hypothetical protein
MPYYKYTQTWFSHSEIKYYLGTLLDKSKENHILEIGCYEGLSSVFFADNFINNKDSTLTCIDPFLNIDNNDHRYLLQNGEESNFDYNISRCKNTEKIKVYKTSSDNFFSMAASTYNFIYVDGCREPDFIKRDMENSFNVLEKGGIMWMNGYDDGSYDGYGGGCDGYGSCDGYGGCDGAIIKKVMDDFLNKYKGEYDVIHSGYQLAIRRK